MATELLEGLSSETGAGNVEFVLKAKSSNNKLAQKQENIRRHGGFLLRFDKVFS